MQASEALQRLVTMADQYAPKVFSDESTPKFRAEVENNQAAIAICQAMLNTAIPVARFRVFVQIDDIPGKQDGQEYTVCAVAISEIQAAVRYLHKDPLNVHVSLWEQRADGAEMLSGYQGRTGPQYRKWVDSIMEFQDGVSVN